MHPIIASCQSLFLALSVKACQNCIQVTVDRLQGQSVLPPAEMQTCQEVKCGADWRLADKSRGGQIKGNEQGSSKGPAAPQRRG